MIGGIGCRPGFSELGAGGDQQRLLHDLRLFAVGDAELSQLFAAILGNRAMNGWPVLAASASSVQYSRGWKAFDFFLALDHHPQRGRLHPAR
jgi:hypothetical protein